MRTQFLKLKLWYLKNRYRAIGREIVQAEADQLRLLREASDLMNQIARRLQNEGYATKNKVPM